MSDIWWFYEWWFYRCERVVYHISFVYIMTGMWASQAIIYSVEELNGRNWICLVSSWRIQKQLELFFLKVIYVCIFSLCLRDIWLCQCFSKQNICFCFEMHWHWLVSRGYNIITSLYGIYISQAQLNYMATLQAKQ